MPRPRHIVILGSTGSIGRQTLEVVAHLNGLGGEHRFEVVGLAAGRSSQELAAQASTLGVRFVAAADGDRLETGAEWIVGPGAAEELVRRAHERVGVDLVVGAIVGSAGLGATLAAAQLGIDVALANKETLVAAGELVVASAARTGARLLPVDSEHSALWQCVQCLGQSRPPMDRPAAVERMVLTASGGALRDLDAASVYAATPAMALAHPNWSMGRKVTVDSASLMNKALELIEAHWLFGMEADRLEVLIHPSSTVHSLVEFADGSVVAQLGAADMRGPIQYALTFPDRPARCGARLDLRDLASLEFREPDHAAFPALTLAYGVIRAGGSAGAVFNAANEEAVSAFLSPGNEGGRRVPFGRIAQAVGAAVDAIQTGPISSLACVEKADDEARAFVRDWLGSAGA